MSVDDSIIQNDNNNFIFNKNSNNIKIFTEEMFNNSFDIYDNLGNIILSSATVANQSNDIFKSLNNGLYYLIFNSKHNRKIKKILIID